MKDEIINKMQMKDEIIDEMQNVAIAEGYVVLEDAVTKLFVAGIPEGAILLSVRVMYHDIIEANEEEN